MLCTVSLKCTHSEFVGGETVAERETIGDKMVHQGGYSILELIHYVGRYGGPKFK